MKQLLVISGKGGTGKTTLVGSFAALAKNAVIADCDVDAPDLHLILKPKILETQPFKGSKMAIKDDSKCIECGKCGEVCRFNAIEDLKIDSIRCEGCGACVYVCPTEAIKLEEKISGYAYISETRYGPMAHAKLRIAEEASGKLVTVVKENAKKLTEKYNKELIIVDGSPGIGCPVIASLAGVDLALIVTEPTISGIHDLERILDVANHFKVRSVVCVNKYDINKENTNRIEDFCRKKWVEVAGRIPYDPVVTKAMIAGKTLIEFSDGKASIDIKKIWESLSVYLCEKSTTTP
ncbi:MAG: 4Fe-4S binding protein [Candidatus Altiarchaeota archaeon]|nr:4Fe-4S binding protein [Candidatus Altiarchaeota archaeon]